MLAINTLIREPIIPFVHKKEEKDIRKIKLEHMITVNIIVGGVAMPYGEERMATMLIAEDDNMEVLLCLDITFIEASQADSLSLTDGMLYSEFQKCLKDVILNQYDVLLT